MLHMYAHTHSHTPPPDTTYMFSQVSLVKPVTPAVLGECTATCRVAGESELAEVELWAFRKELLHELLERDGGSISLTEIGARLKSRCSPQVLALYKVRNRWRESLRERQTGRQAETDCIASGTRWME